MDCTLADITEKLLESEKCLIFIHTCPDGDTIGAGVALMFRLRALGKAADVIVDAEVPACFDILYGTEEIKSRLTRTKYDTYIAVDCASPLVMGVYAGRFKEFEGATLNIDHHSYNTCYADFNCVIPCSSCCELITDMYRANGWDPSDSEADLLMLGLMTDSGRFSHRDVTEKTFLDAAFLAGHGADPSWLNDIVYGGKAAEIDNFHKLAGIATRYYSNDRIAVFCLMDCDIEYAGVDRSITDGMENFLLGLKQGTEVAVFLKEQEGRYLFKAFVKSRRLDLSAVAKKFRGTCAGPDYCTFMMSFVAAQDCIDRTVKAISSELDAQGI